MISVTSAMVALLIVFQQELIFQAFQEEGIVTPSEPRGAEIRPSLVHVHRYKPVGLQRGYITHGRKVIDIDGSTLDGYWVDDTSVVADHFRIVKLPEPGVILQLVAGGVGLVFLNKRRKRW